MIKKNNPFNSDKKISKKYLLKNGSIIDVIKNKIIKEDLYIKNKVVEKIGKNLSKIVDEDTEIIDCKNLYISPGLIDMRVNISEPGHEHKETIKSASMSAASGGITSLICMPNTIPPIDQPAIIHSIQRKAREVALSKIFCTAWVLACSLKSHEYFTSIAVYLSNVPFYWATFINIIAIAPIITFY